MALVFLHGRLPPLWLPDPAVPRPGLQTSGTPLWPSGGAGHQGGLCPSWRSASTEKALLLSTARLLPSQGASCLGPLTLFLRFFPCAGHFTAITAHSLLTNLEMGIFAGNRPIASPAPCDCQEAGPTETVTGGTVPPPLPTGINVTPVWAFEGAAILPHLLHSSSSSPASDVTQASRAF